MESCDKGWEGMSELKPCPFCGNKAEVQKVRYWSVVCVECGSRTDGYSNEGFARTAWNIRAAQEGKE